MRTPRILMAALALAGSAAFGGTADVRFVEPEHFTDFSSDITEQSAAIRAITGELDRLSQRLPPDAVLHVDVLDVDLAGSLRPDARGVPVRVIRGRGEPPVIKLRWALEARGQGMGSGEDQLSDLGTLDRTYANPGAVGGFYYERRLLDRWFNDNFAPRAQTWRR
jgi:hypothetical protein